MAQETLLGFPAHTFPFRCGNLYWRRIARFPFLGYLRAKSRLAARRIYYFIDSLFPFHSALILHEIFPYGKRAVSEL